eukprot:207011_1
MNYDDKPSTNVNTEEATNDYIPVTTMRVTTSTGSNTYTGEEDPDTKMKASMDTHEPNENEMQKQMMAIGASLRNDLFCNPTALQDLPLWEELEANISHHSAMSAINTNNNQSMNAQGMMCNDAMIDKKKKSTQHGNIDASTKKHHLQRNNDMNAADNAGKFGFSFNLNDAQHNDDTKANELFQFTDLEIQEIEIHRDLFAKIVRANIFDVDHIIKTVNSTRPLFESWMKGTGSEPTVVNDLQNTIITNTQDTLSMQMMRCILNKIEEQLEAIVQEDTVRKAKQLLCEFHCARETYQEGVAEMETREKEELVQACLYEGTKLEMRVVRKDNAESAEWIPVKVWCNSEQSGGNNVWVETEHGVQYPEMSSLRLPKTN